MKPTNLANPDSRMTMTVRELIEKLQTYDPELPVIAEWESVGAAIHPDNFDVEEYHRRKELVINVENYG